MLSLRTLRWISLGLLLSSLSTACMTNKTLTVGATASLLEDVAKSAYRQSDLRLIREGMPSYLMLIDGMAQALPDNERLLISAAQSYASFASAFIQDQDREYANILYSRAKDYALRALELIGFKDPLSKPFDDFERDLSTFGQKKDVAYLFWAASCWGNWISLNQNSIEAVAELPRVELMVKRVLELDEGFYYGGAHIFMGVLWASRPPVAGGDLNRAKEHFLKAIELGRGEFLLTYIYYADYYAKKAFDKELFIATLETVLKTPADITPDLTLLNTVAHQKAKKMLSQADEYF
jgi:hypothetical protein